MQYRRAEMRKVAANCVTLLHIIIIIRRFFMHVDLNLFLQIFAIHHHTAPMIGIRGVDGVLARIMNILNQVTRFM